MPLWLDVALNVAKNLLMGIPVVRKLRLFRPRTGPADVTSLDRYVFTGLRTIEQHTELEGLDVLEIGPGDHLGLGLACLARGAKSYTALDRFPGQYSGPVAKAWYRAIREAWTGEWPASLDPEKFPEGYPVKTLPIAVEQAPLGSYDLVFSVAVGEHVSDIQAFARATANLLRPGGTALHVVDFSQHGFERYNDPYLFLKIPDWIYRLMGSERGLPNRHRLHEYTEAFRAAGLNVQVCDVSRSDVLPTHGDLAKRFRAMPVGSLAVRCATLVCELSVSRSGPLLRRREQ